MDEINVTHRAYQLQPNDIFDVHLENFLAEAALWSPSFRIVGTKTYKRKHWWQFWKPRKITYLKMMYLGGYENE